MRRGLAVRVELPRPDLPVVVRLHVRVAQARRRERPGRAQSWTNRGGGNELLSNLLSRGRFPILHSRQKEHIFVKAHSQSCSAEDAQGVFVFSASAAGLTKT